MHFALHILPRMRYLRQTPLAGASLRLSIPSTGRLVRAALAWEFAALDHFTNIECILPYNLTEIARLAANSFSRRQPAAFNPLNGAYLIPST